MRNYLMRPIIGRGNKEIVFIIDVGFYLVGFIRGQLSECVYRQVAPGTIYNSPSFSLHCLQS